MANLTGKSTINISQMIQKIDLRELFGRTPTDREKRNFSDEAILFINNRTLDGNDVDGDTFTQYSEKYAKAKGVTRSSVDLYAEGDMLDAVVRDLPRESKNEVALAVKGSDQIEIGATHQKGLGFMPEREWFGLTKEQATTIAKNVKSSTNTSIAKLKEGAGPQGTAPKQTNSTTLSDLIAELDKLGIRQVE